MGFPDGKLDKEQESTLEDALTQQIGQFNPDIVSPRIRVIIIQTTPRSVRLWKEY